MQRWPARGAPALLTVAVLMLLTGVGVALAGGGGADDAPPSAPADLANAEAAIAPRRVDDARPSRGGSPPEAQDAAQSERPPAPAEPPPLEDFGAVESQRPAVRLDGVTTDDPLPAVLGHSGVRFATVMRTSTVAVLGADGQPHEVRVAAVDPRGFRVLTPQVTADAQALWQHLVDGAAAVEHAVAERLGVALGGELAIADRPPVHVGAFAGLGDPAPADVIVSSETGQRLGLDQGASLSVLVSLSGATRPSRAAAELAELLGAHATPLVEDRVIELGVTSVGAGQWDDVWDRLAACESSGRWHLDSGNGYYGGLQFLPESWWWVGGAGMPHEASREEQIARAKILLAYQGWEAWPACSLALGYR